MFHSNRILKIYLDCLGLPVVLYIDTLSRTIGLFRHFDAFFYSNIDRLAHLVMIVAIDSMALLMLPLPMSCSMQRAQIGLALTHHGHIFKIESNIFHQNKFKHYRKMTQEFLCFILTCFERKKKRFHVCLLCQLWKSMWYSYRLNHFAGWYSDT